MARPSDWVFIAYFSYVAIIAAAMRPAIFGRAVLFAAGLTGLILVLARFSSKYRLLATLRVWFPLAYILCAYREMNWFTPDWRDYRLERSWIVWDRILLQQWDLRGLIESTGVLLPGYFELCYLLVYGVGAFSIAAFYWTERLERVDPFLVVYSIGTLLSYGMFPFFPSDPPRVVFPTDSLPTVTTFFRDLNLALVGNYGIHSSVFPSAHVSSAFAAAWGLMHFLAEEPWIGRCMLIYAVSVSIATIYGRYHYASDALAGAVVGSIPLAFVVFIQRRHAA